MAALDFPSSPTVGQTYTANNITYKWDGVSWNTFNPVDLANVTGTLTSTNGGTGVTTSTGTGSNVLSTSPSLVTPSFDAETYSSQNITAGTNAQGQGAITKDNAIVTSTPNNPSGVTLPSATTGRCIVVANRGTNPISIFPASGGQIDSLSSNTAITLPAGQWMEFNAGSGTQWYSTANATINATSLAGVVGIDKGGTGAITASGALTSLGAYPATNPNGYTTNTGTVTSVAMTVPAFLTVTGSPITTAGTLAVAYSAIPLPITNGGTGATTAGTALSNLGAAPTASPTFTGKVTTAASTTTAAGFILPHGAAPTTPVNGDLWTTTAGIFVRINGATVGPLASGSGSGTVTSVGVSGGTTGLTTSGGPITTSGTITLAGTLAVANGGTGSTTATGAATNLGLGTASNVQFSSLGVGTAASGTAGEIRATNNVTAYYTSDIKFKENIRTIPNALTTVLAIGGKLFDWTDDYIEEHGGEDGYFVRKADFGVVAQDVDRVFPLGTRTKQDGTLAVDYEKLCALAFAAIAELHAEIILLKAKK